MPGSMTTGGFNVELPFIHPRICELSWFVHCYYWLADYFNLENIGLTSSHECAETVETAAINTVINCLIFTDLECVGRTGAEEKSKSRKSLENLIKPLVVEVLKK
jgi:hypothetical protein